MSRRLNHAGRSALALADAVALLAGCGGGGSPDPGAGHAFLFQDTASSFRP